MAPAINNYNFRSILNREYPLALGDPLKVYVQYIKTKTSYILYTKISYISNNFCYINIYYTIEFILLYKNITYFYWLLKCTVNSKIFEVLVIRIYLGMHEKENETFIFETK